uniref:Uncharacterized protein n=1 Tax=Rhizophora mucronata TaxID=61149 RepID=A0A2P2JKZ4_RHIMU
MCSSAKDLLVSWYSWSVPTAIYPLRIHLLETELMNIIRQINEIMLVIL